MFDILISPLRREGGWDGGWEFCFWDGCGFLWVWGKYCVLHARNLLFRYCCSFCPSPFSLFIYVCAKERGELHMLCMQNAREARTGYAGEGPGGKGNGKKKRKMQSSHILALLPTSAAGGLMTATAGIFYLGKVSGEEGKSGGSDAGKVKLGTCVVA